MATSIVT